MISVNNVNKFLFSRSEIYTIFDGSGNEFTDFLGAPVYPVSETPEVDSPYTIYTWRTNVGYPEWYFNNDTITYSIWDHNIARLQEYEAMMRKYLGNVDESAEAFRLWAANNKVKGILMHEIRYLGSTDVFPQDEVGGVVGKNLTFKTTYVDCKPAGTLDIS